MNAEPSRAQLRDALRRERRALNPPQRLLAASALADRLGQKPPWKDATSGELPRVAGYWAIDGEISLHAVLGRFGSEFHYHLPCLEPGNRLSFAPWSSGEVTRPNRYGIPEPAVEADRRIPPEALEVVMVPLLGFDRQGRRIGSGAGYYDRSFAFRSDATALRPRLIGVAYAMQEQQRIPSEHWDVPLDAVVTEREWIDCVAERSKQENP